MSLKTIFIRKKTIRKNKGDHRGFTLIETVMALVILSIAVAGILQVFFTGLAPRNAPLPIEITIGTQLVQERLERIKADRKNPARGFGYIISANYPAETLTAPFAGFTRTTTISPGWQGEANYTLVAVAVANNNRTVASATTLVTNY
jgi:prepilin-type N-terminal cleavage/methylation domain-containing protein